MQQNPLWTHTVSHEGWIYLKYLEGWNTGGAHEEEAVEIVLRADEAVTSYSPEIPPEKKKNMHTQHWPIFY